MASSLLSSRPFIASSPSCPASLALSSINSTFVPTAQLHRQPLSLQKGGALRAAFPPVECSSRPRKKCTAHHNKTRPKKHSLSEKNRKPTVYPKPPTPPPVCTRGWGDEDDDDSAPAAPASIALEAEPVVVGG